MVQAFRPQPRGRKRDDDRNTRRRQDADASLQPQHFRHAVWRAEGHLSIHHDALRMQNLRGRCPGTRLRAGNEELRRRTLRQGDWLLQRHYLRHTLLCRRHLRPLHRNWPRMERMGRDGGAHLHRGWRTVSRLCQMRSEGNPDNPRPRPRLEQQRRLQQMRRDKPRLLYLCKRLLRTPRCERRQGCTIHHHRYRL